MKWLRRPPLHRWFVGMWCVFLANPPPKTWFLSRWENFMMHPNSPHLVIHIDKLRSSFIYFVFIQNLRREMGDFMDTMYTVNWVKCKIGIRDVVRVAAMGGGIRNVRTPYECSLQCTRVSSGKLKPSCATYLPACLFACLTTCGYQWNIQNR